MGCVLRDGGSDRQTLRWDGVLIPVVVVVVQAVYGVVGSLRGGLLWIVLSPCGAVFYCCSFLINTLSLLWQAAHCCWQSLLGVVVLVLRVYVPLLLLLPPPPV